MFNFGFNSPSGKKDSNYNLNSDSFTDEEFRGDYVGGVNLIYKGFARPGSPEDQPVWQIAFATYDANDNITSIKWPLRKIDNTNGASANTSAASNQYEFCWSLRTSYTYV